MTKIYENFPALHAEIVRTERGATVILTQPTAGEEISQRITLHPAQLEHLAATLSGANPQRGLLDEVSETLARRIDILRSHLCQVHDDLRKLPHYDQDVHWAVMNVGNLLEMAEEFCSDFPLKRYGQAAESVSINA